MTYSSENTGIHIAEFTGQTRQERTGLPDTAEGFASISSLATIGKRTLWSSIRVFWNTDILAAATIRSWDVGIQQRIQQWIQISSKPRSYFRLWIKFRTLYTRMTFILIVKVVLTVKCRVKRLDIVPKLRQHSYPIGPKWPLGQLKQPWPLTWP